MPLMWELMVVNRVREREGRQRGPYLNEPKGLSKGEKKSITEPLFFFDFAESFLFLVCIPSFFIVKGLGTCQGRNKNKYPKSGGARS